ncbi:MAG: hypothetical protein LBB27_03770 [Tannerellaceae bacterium]|nr:hypothetical protein [Tannerellaceae bacterium]
MIQEYYLSIFILFFIFATTIGAVIYDRIVRKRYYRWLEEQNRTPSTQ